MRPDLDWVFSGARLLAAMALASAAGAQVPPAPPPAPPELPRSVLPPTAQELDRPIAAPPAAPAARVRSRGVQPGPCPDALLNSPLRAPLRQVAFSGPGGAALPPAVAAALAGVGRGLDGGERPLRDVCALRDEAAAALTRARFVGVVQVPEQTLADGTLRLAVITARIAELRVRGDPGRSEAQLSALLGRLRALDPLNESDAERVLLLANDIPGTSATLELRPSPDGRPGEVIGEVLIERIPGAALVNVQNHGSRQIGRWSGVARGELYNLTGLADRTFVSLFSTGDFAEQQVAQGGHDFALGSGGLRLGATLTYAWTRPTLPDGGAGLDLSSRSLLAGVQASYPLVRTTAANLRLAGGFDLVDQRTRAAGALINVDKLRTLFVRLEGDRLPRAASRGAPPWRIGGFVEARQGVSLFGATRQGQVSGSAIPTRFEGDPQALVLRAAVSGEARARFGPASPYAVTLAVDARGQYAKNPLLAFDEFAVGNLTLGRGYDPGATSGDRAAGLAAELRLGKPVPLGRDDWALEAIGFYDAVRIRNLDTNNFERDRTLESVGGGVRASWGGRARLDLLYARPLDKALEIDAERAPARVLVSLTVRAFPWR